MNIPVIIPAYKPDQNLIKLIDDLVKNSVKNIIVTIDGDPEKNSNIIEDLHQRPACHVLIHAINLGKGRALKTALNYALLTFPSSVGVVTADADGQHKPADIIRVAHELSKSHADLVLGSRVFKSHEIPLRSRFGNITTQKVFAAITGCKISDTQTGLRGIPMGFVPKCLSLKGERYEYEIGMLLNATSSGYPIREIPIETIYIDGNKSSHFNPILDSARIYFVLIRFIASSLFTSLIDFLVFGIAQLAGSSILVCMILARAISGSINFYVNKNLVFSSKSRAWRPLIQYWSLVIILGTISFFGVSYLNTYLSVNPIIAKVIIETMLFVASFSIQRSLIFSNED